MVGRGTGTGAMPLLMPLANDRREEEDSTPDLDILVCCAAWTPLPDVLVFDMWVVFRKGVLL